MSGQWTLNTLDRVLHLCFNIYMKIRVVIEKDEDAYVAYCPELPGCQSFGYTEEEARRNIAEAIELYLRPSKPIPVEAKVYEIAV